MARSYTELAFAVIAVAAFLASTSVSGARVIRKATGDKFIVEGKVFCDTCQAGFETPATTYIAGAKVRVECKSRKTGAETCNFEGVTDETGSYKILVEDEHEHEICESVLVESPRPECSKLLDGRERARVFLTRNNGIASDVRYANALGFVKDTPMALCGELMKQYTEYGV